MRWPVSVDNRYRSRSAGLLSLINEIYLLRENYNRTDVAVVIVPLNKRRNGEAKGETPRASGERERQRERNNFHPITGDPNGLFARPRPTRLTL